MKINIPLVNGRRDACPNQNYYAAKFVTTGFSFQLCARDSVLTASIFKKRHQLSAKEPDLPPFVCSILNYSKKGQVHPFKSIDGSHCEIPY